METAEPPTLLRRTHVGQVRADQAEFGDWIRPHWAMMHALAVARSVRGDGEDVLQDALAAAWRKRSQFDSARGSARNWLLAIVADQARKSHRRRRPEPVPIPDRISVDASPDLDLRRAVNALPGRQRLAVELHYFLQLPVTDVAAVMSCAEGTVKASLAAARKNLRATLGEDAR